MSDSVSGCVIIYVNPACEWKEEEKEPVNYVHYIHLCP